MTFTEGHTTHMPYNKMKKKSSRKHVYSHGLLKERERENDHDLFLVIGVLN